MWLTLFAITFVAAAGFAAAAVWRSWKELRSFLAEVADCQADDAGGGGSDGPAMDDDHLLLDRMRLLRIDLKEAVRSDPLMFQNLVTRCWGCASKAQCRRDLRDASAGEEWRDYCPNAPMLSAISTVCGVGVARPAEAHSNINER